MILRNVLALSALALTCFGIGALTCRHQSIAGDTARHLLGLPERYEVLYPITIEEGDVLELRPGKNDQWELIRHSRIGHSTRGFMAVKR